MHPTPIYYCTAATYVVRTRTRPPPNTDDRDWAKWGPTIPALGWYSVAVYVGNYSPGAAADTTQAKYQIHHADGVATVTVNQNANRCSLGLYRFKAGTTGYVYMGERRETGDTCS